MASTRLAAARTSVIEGEQTRVCVGSDAKREFPRDMSARTVRPHNQPVILGEVNGLGWARAVDVDLVGEPGHVLDSQLRHLVDTDVVEAAEVDGHPLVTLSLGESFERRSAFDEGLRK